MPDHWCRGPNDDIQRGHDMAQTTWGFTESDGQAMPLQVIVSISYLITRCQLVQLSKNKVKNGKPKGRYASVKQLHGDGEHGMSLA